jgi:hypothetical protein
MGGRVVLINTIPEQTFFLLPAFSTLLPFRTPCPLNARPEKGWLEGLRLAVEPFRNVWRRQGGQMVAVRKIVRTRSLVGCRGPEYWQMPLQME